MSTEITVPSLGESVSEATVAQWFKKPGDAVEADEPILELETDKVALEVNAPKAGVLSDIKAEEGDTVEVGDLLGLIDEGAEASASSADDDKSKEAEEDTDSGEEAQADKEAEEEAEADEKPAEKKPAEEEKAESKGSDAKLAPAAARLVEEKGVDASRIEGTGRGGRVTKADVIKFLEEGGADKPAAKEEKKAPKSEPASKPEPAKDKAPRETGDREERVPMSRLRRTIARRLKEAQDTAAMLTTFNEIDVSALLEARENYKELFEKKHNVRLGFMSFFAKACVTALHDLPAVNAEIDGDDIIYKNHYDIGVAVSAPQGLVVPVVRDVDQLSLAGIEKTVSELARKARDGELSMAELQGGTFTITNGGVFGSLMSTPILNTPQSGILGMHKIQERPVAIDGEVQVRPMMYVALSYDHRIVDGREAVTFLVRIKELLEDPHRMLLDL